MKEYYLNNIEIITERQKIYRNTYKEQINARKSEKCICDCGRNYTIGNKSRHLTTKKHLDYITQESAMSNITLLL
jgi:hypothetical protein